MALKGLKKNDFSAVYPRNVQELLSFSNTSKEATFNKNEKEMRNRRTNLCQN